ncbi:MAG: 2-hydroxymuconate tautomerase [bacterium]
MPVVNIAMLKGRSIEQKRKLVKRLTEVMAEILEIKPEVISIIIEEMDWDNWATAGEIHSDKFGPGPVKKGL